MAKLILSRKSGWLNRGSSFKVFIDNNKVGEIRNNQVQEYELEPGIHDLECKVNWMSSNKYDVDITADKNIYLSVVSGMKFFLPLYILMLAGIFLPYIFKLMKVQIPESLKIVLPCMIFPAALYMVLYMTIYRKKYLEIKEDTGNPFR